MVAFPLLVAAGDATAVMQHTPAVNIVAGEQQGRIRTGCVFHPDTRNRVLKFQNPSQNQVGVRCSGKATLRDFHHDSEPLIGVGAG